jgi:hypothetical protein
MNILEWKRHHPYFVVFTDINELKRLGIVAHQYTMELLNIHVSNDDASSSAFSIIVLIIART